MPPPRAQLQLGHRATATLSVGHGARAVLRFEHTPTASVRAQLHPERESLLFVALRALPLYRRVVLYGELRGEGGIQIMGSLYDAHSSRLRIGTVRGRGRVILLRGLTGAPAFVPLPDFSFGGDCGLYVRALRGGSGDEQEAQS